MNVDDIFRKKQRMNDGKGKAVQIIETVQAEEEEKDDVRMIQENVEEADETIEEYVEKAGHDAFLDIVWQKRFQIILKFIL